MIKIYSNQNIVDPLTIVLSNRDQTHLGQLSNVSNVKYTGHMNAADELSFVVNKYADDNEELLWDEITDLKLIWIKELNEYFEMSVTLIDKTYLEKTITAKSLCESELSQSILHNIEINTEADISRDDYDVKYPTIFYRDLSGLSGEDYKKARNSSLLHRILDKVPAYTIGHVDASLANLQRTFSINETSIYDWLIGECSEAFNCIFIFNSQDRTINAYDLYSNCNTCGHRGEFLDTCPECGSTDITYGYGNDTEIFCTTENLTDQIDYNTDVGSIKNCFRLVAGDDDMTAAIININPNGSQYIYKFSEESLHDMPAELVQKLHDYDVLYQDYKTTHSFTLDQLPEKTIGSDTVNFNDLVDKYDDAFYLARDKHLTEIPEAPDTFTGYTNLMKYVYCGYELQSYLQSGMMPVSYTHGAVNASTEAAKINRGDMGSYISLTSFTSATSVKTVESALLNYAKVFVKTGYVKLKVNTDSFVNNTTSGIWTGYFTVSNYSDENDIVDTVHFSMAVNDDFSTFMEQKVAKQIVNSTKEEHDTIYNVLRPENTLAEFKEALTYYSLARIESFRDALNAVLSVLQEAKQASVGADLYDSQYLPYYRKYMAACDEFNLRAQEIELCEETLSMLLAFRADIQDTLNFKKYLDPTPLTNYYETLTTYIREDDYNNSNYISEGLNNDQLFANAQEFFKAAEQELIKSSFYQHSITANLYNLLLLKEFEPLKDKFELGNWIRVGIDNNVYRLRLISYSIDYENLTNLTTEFSDLTRTVSGYNDVRSVLQQAQTMATSYNAVTKQAESGQDASEYVNSMLIEGLSTVNSKLKNNNNEEITITAAGIVGRSYDDITETFSPKQVRLTHNILAFTKDNWETVETALGEITYTDTHGQLITDYGLMAKIVIAGYISGSTIQGGKIISAHIQNEDDSSYMDLTNATEDASHNPIYFLKSNDNFTVDKNGKIKSAGGIFSNNDYSSYLNLSNSFSEFPYYLKYLDNFTIDEYGTIKSKYGIYTNLDDSSYINLSGIYMNTHFYRTIPNNGNRIQINMQTRAYKDVWRADGEYLYIDVYDIIDPSTFEGGWATLWISYDSLGTFTKIDTISTLHEGTNKFQTKVMPEEGEGRIYYVVLIGRNGESGFSIKLYANNGDTYRDFLKFQDCLKIDSKGKITSKYGIFSNQDNKSYLNFSGSYNLYRRTTRTSDGSTELIRIVPYNLEVTGFSIEHESVLYINATTSYNGIFANAKLYKGGSSDDYFLEEIPLHNGLNKFGTLIQPAENDADYNNYYVRFTGYTTGVTSDIEMYIENDYQNIFQAEDNFIIDRYGNVKAKGSFVADNFIADGGMIKGAELRGYHSEITSSTTYYDQTLFVAVEDLDYTAFPSFHSSIVKEDEPIYIYVDRVSTASTLNGEALLYENTGSSWEEVDRIPLNEGLNQFSYSVYNKNHTFQIFCYKHLMADYRAHIYIKKPHTVIDSVGTRVNNIKINNGGFQVDAAGNVTVQSGMFNQFGMNGYMRLDEYGDVEKCWQNRFGCKNWYCMYKGSDNKWHVAGGGSVEIWTVITGALNGSDRRMKKDVIPIDPEFSKGLINDTNVYSFRYKHDDTELHYGVISQEVDELLKKRNINSAKMVMHNAIGNEYDAVEYKEYIAHLINCIQDLYREIDDLKTKIN